MITKSQNLSVAQLKAVGVVTHYEMEKETSHEIRTYSTAQKRHYFIIVILRFSGISLCNLVKQKVKNIFNNATDMTVHRHVIKRLNCLAESTLAIMTVINTTLGGVA